MTVGTAHWESTVVKEITSKLIRDNVHRDDVHSDNDSNDGSRTRMAGRGQQDSNGDEEERSQQLI